MTSRDRVLTAFSHAQPDRVPVWCGASPEFRGMLRARLGLGEDDEALSRRLGDDFRRVFARYAGPAGRSPSSCFTHPEATSRTPFGVESHPLADAASAADIERFAWPDPYWMDVSSVREEALVWGGEHAVLGGDWSPFFHDAIDLFGMERFMTLMVENPAVVEAALARMAAYYAEVSRRIFEAAHGAIDVFFIGNDFGTQTGPVVSPAMFHRFFWPHLRRLADLGHAFGLKVQLHCCGGFESLIPLLIAAGIDGLQSLQPDARDMAPERLKRLYGRDIVLNGCLDTHHLLIAGTPDLVRRETRRIVEIMKPGGGYIASPSHDYLLPETNVDNTLALYDTVREFGRYE
jgi:uroporphyrinogen decarboxylase